MGTILTSDAARQPVAFEAFFEAERVRLLRALYLLTGNAEEAEEVLQEAFIAIWERWDRVGAMEDPIGYLYKTAMNRQRSRYRRARRTARRVIGQAHGRDGFADVEDRVELTRARRPLAPTSRSDRVDRAARLWIGRCRTDDGRCRSHRATPCPGGPSGSPSHPGGLRCLT